MADSPLIKKLRQRAKDVGGLAAKGILNSGRGADAVGAAMRGAQTGRQAVDEGTARVLDALGLATRDDVERLSKRIGKIRKRLQALVDALE
ncbi:MAG: hypothetical protein AAF654_09585 [Myxococcota bacterium]